VKGVKVGGAANAKRLVVLVVDLFGVVVISTAAITGVALWCLFFLIIHFGCCSSMQVRNGVSVWGFLIGEPIEWISEIFTVTVYK
jgi:hypothetical protein